MVMIRRGKFKFIHSPADPDQLFDLERDLGERDNLADSPACAALMLNFRAEVGKRWDFAKLDAQVRDSQPPAAARRRCAQQGQDPGGGTSQPFRKSASRQYVRNSMDADDLEAMARFPRLHGPENSRAGRIGVAEAWTKTRPRAHSDLLLLDQRGFAPLTASRRSRSPKMRSAWVFSSPKSRAHDPRKSRNRLTPAPARTSRRPW